ncbi:MAG: HNH endonuclease, partial [Gemmatimonadetes bacterium]|nr:HNH endonuclease [Gemmatimonadota bacterium]
VEAASDALYREKGVSAETSSEDDSARRRADALGLVAERALAAGFGENSPVSGTRAERYQVLLHVDADTLSEESTGLGRSELEDGTRVSAETSRRVSCDGAVVGIGHAPDGSVLDVGRRTRTIPPSLRRALEARDRGCRFPGCGLRFTDAHHVKHWADGGETKLENLVLLCSHHHRLVHEEGWQLEWWGKERLPAFIDPRGQVHVNTRSAVPALEADPVAGLTEDTRSRGADPDFMTAGARWKREADIPDRVYLRAMEALG